MARGWRLTARQGPKDADFDAFVVATAVRLQRLAYSFCRDWYLADDLVQATYEKVYCSWGRIEADDPYGYARTTLLRTFLSERGRSWRRHERLTDPLPDPQTAEDQIDLRMDLVAAVGRLPPRQRVVVVLRYVEDLSTGQTAAAMGVSQGTVKSTLHDAMAALRQDLTSDRRSAMRGQG